MDSTYVKPTDERDLRDLAALARGMMPLTRCPGGRYTPRDDTQCAHCGIMRPFGMDWDDKTFCGQPLEDDGYTPFDATEARRIMQESAARFEEDQW